MSRKFPNWCYCEGNPAAFQPAVEPPTNPGCTTSSCKKLDGVAAWLLNGVAAVFFNTLERCSCINIGTIDEPDDQNSNCQPLVSSNDVHFQQLALQNTAETPQRN